MTHPIRLVLRLLDLGLRAPAEESLGDLRVFCI